MYETNFYIQFLVSIIFGVLVGLIIYHKLQNKRFALRLIDLLSYSLTIYSLITGLTNFFIITRDDYSDFSKRMQFDDEVHSIYSSVGTAEEKICLSSLTAFQSNDCKNIMQYGRDIVDLHMAQDPQPIQRIPISMLEKLPNSNEINSKISTYNEQVSAFRAAKDFHSLKNYRGNFRAFWFLSIGFGLGLMRRFVDAHSDYKAGRASDRSALSKSAPE